MQTIAIVGVGLIGGSLGLALRKVGFSGTILGVSSESTIAAALRLSAIDRGVTLQQAASEADVIYLAKPIRGIIETIQELGPIARPGTFITDAGSTKVEIVRVATTSLRGCDFVGGHPMAGKESRGVESADPDLFRNRPYVFTPVSANDLKTRHATAFAGWVEKIGSKTVTMSPEDHDKTVAYTSHLPQLASTALAALLGSLPDDRLMVAGPGAVDMTRLALSAYDIWRDILETNRSAVDHVLGVYIDKLTEVRHNLQTQGVGEDFKVAADAAARLRQ